MDSQFVDKIVNEVKAQGVFDQFRRECMSDCDTKPAYQNLRQRVENSVSRFLSDQKWKPEMNKNQLRERLRKHIADGRFLEIGVERIVDQVVLPKISTIFQPKIEDIVYKYLGIEKLVSKCDDERVHSHNNYQNGNLAIKTDLLPTDHLEEVSPDSDKSNIKHSVQEELMEEDDDESPPFEPLVEESPKILKNENSLSGLSGLTSQSPADTKKENIIKEEDEKKINISGGDNTQESQLSEVSSNSRLSIEEDEDEASPKKETEKPKVDICEEAQMPKFHENSNSCPPMSTEALHFDIKKDEIKFEGTDRNMEYVLIKSEDDVISQIPPPPPPPEPVYVPPPPEPVYIPPPPTEKTKESYYDDDSEKGLQIVEETQTKDENDMQNNGDGASDYKDCFVKLEIIEEKDCTVLTPEVVKTEKQSSPDPTSLKKLQLNSNQFDDLGNKSSEPNNVEASSPKPLGNMAQNNTEAANKEGSRHCTSHKKHSKDRKADKEREKPKYRSGSKNSSNSDKKINSNEKSSSHSRYSSVKDISKHQKVSNKDTSSSYNHKNKNEKHSSDSRDKSRSERDKKRYRDKNTDDHSSSRSRYHRRKSADSEDGNDRKDSSSIHKSNVSNKKISDKSKSSNHSKHETENSSKEKLNNSDEKDAGGEILVNDLEKIEFMLGIQRSENKLVTKENEPNNKITCVKSENNDIESQINRTPVDEDAASSKGQKPDTKSECIALQEPLETDVIDTSDNEKDLKYFIITPEEKNDHKNLVKTYEDHMKCYNTNEISNQSFKVKESAKRKLSPDRFENKNSSDSTESKEKRPKTDIKSERNVGKTSPTLAQQQEINVNVKKNDLIK